MKLNIIPNLDAAEISRFWLNVAVRGDGECWPWLLSTTNYGHGRFYISGRAYIASRVAYWISHGPTDIYVCHSCDNPPCCNPEHLFSGTQSQNMIDSAMKLRLNPGGVAKLSPGTVVDIKLAAMDPNFTRKQISEKFNITQGHLSNVLNGKRWPTVELWQK